MVLFIELFFNFSLYTAASNIRLQVLLWSYKNTLKCLHKFSCVSFFCGAKVCVWPCKCVVTRTSRGETKTVKLLHLKVFSVMCDCAYEIRIQEQFSLNFADLLKNKCFEICKVCSKFQVLPKVLFLDHQKLLKTF